MVQRTVSVGLVANVSNYVANMNRAAEATRKTAAAAVGSEKQLRAQGEVYTKIGTAALGAGALAAAGVAVVVKATAEYGAKMAQLQSLSKASAADMKRLSAAAMEQGKAYGYSASQVADAEIELTKAGLSTADILGGGLKSALSLAAAGQLDVGKATEISTIAMTDFKLKASELPHVADLLAAGADKALGSVGDLGEGLANGGQQAHNMGLSIGDTVGTLSAFANAGIIGAEGGTQLRSMFIQLQKVTPQAQKVLDQYGISIYDAGGKFVGMTKLAGELQTKLGGLTQAQQNAALATIFGSHAITGASVIMQLGAKNMQGWIDKVNEYGFANAQAAGKMNSLQGDVQKLSASFETNLIKAGSGANDVLRNLVKTTTNVVGAVGGLPAPLLSAGLALTVAGGGVALIGGAALIATPKIAAFRVQLAEAGVTGKSLGVSFAKGAALSLGIAALTAGLAGLAQQGQATKQQLAETGTAAASQFKGLDKLFTSSTFGGAQAGLKNALDFEGLGSAVQKFGSLGGVISGLSDTVLHNEGTFDALGQQLSGLAQQNLPAAQRGFAGIVSQYHLTADQTKKLLGLMPAYRDTLADLAQKAGVTATDANLLAIAQGKGAIGAKAAAEASREAAASAEKQSAELAKLTGSGDDATQSMNQLHDALAGLGSTELDARSAARHFQQAIEDATTAAKKNGRTLDINTQAGRDNQEALDGIASSAAAAAASYVKNGGDAKGAAKIIADGRAAYIRTAEAMGASKAEANRLADALHLIPKSVGTAINLTGGEGALSAIRLTASALASLNGRTASVAVHYTTTGQNLATGGVRFADGGAVNGPGPKGKDSVAAVLAPGEHVLTASDVDKLGGQSAVYALRAGLAAYAKGGAVGDTTREISRDEAKVRAAQRAYDRAGKATKSDRKQDLQDAKQTLKDARDKLTTLRQAAEDFVSEQRRGVTDPLSYVDQLRSMSRDSNYSASRRNSFDKAANKYEASLVRLAKQSDAAATKLADLKQSSAEMTTSITQAIAGRYSSSSAAGTQSTSTRVVRNGISFTSTSSALSAASLDSYWKTAAIDTATFAAQLQQLAKRGVNGQLLAEIAQDANGPQLAAALLAADGAQLASIDANYAATQKNAGAAGSTVADYNFAGLIEKAQKAADQITNEISTDGEKLRKLIASAFGLKGYATGTLSATPGLHLVGERGPELLWAGGGERIWNHAQTRSYIRGGGTAAAAVRGQAGQTIVRMPDTITVQDATGFKATMQVIAQQEIVRDSQGDAVHLMYGGAA